MTTDVSSGEPGETGARSRFAAFSTIRVWDLPVRLTHWSFAFLVPAMWWTAENSEWGLHKRFGLTLLGLLMFRILWGFFGTRTARFSSFVKGPGAVIGYLQGTYNHRLGHSPLAALSVLALLGVMLVQVGAGLFAGDPFDGATGPLNPLIGVMTADALTDWHEWFYWVVFAMVALHLSAIAFYGGVKHEDLLSPMISGTKTADDAEAAEQNGETPWIAFLLCAGIAAGVTVWVAYGAPPLS